MLDETQNTVPSENFGSNIGNRSLETRGLVDRVKGILLSPKTEWAVIAAETPDTGKITTGYVLPLILIPTIAAFIGYGLLGGAIGGAMGGVAITAGIAYAIISFAIAIGGIFLNAAIINALAGTFNSRNDFGRALQLVVYASTPGWVAGVLNIFPFLSIAVMFLAMIYSVYLLYLGLPHVMQTPKEKVIGYMVVSLLVLIVVYYVLMMIISAIIFGIFGLSLAAASTAF